MKNVIILIIDSLCYDIVGDTRFGKSATPFLDSLKNKSIYAENLYSQGPFTESGLKSLLCSCDTMDNGGYLQRFGEAEVFYTAPFSDAGYEIFSSYYQLFLYDELKRKTIDHIIYIDLFDYRKQWEARIPFYIEKKKNGNLTEYDIEQCVMAYNVIFSLMEEFYCGYLDDYCDKRRYDLIKTIMPNNIHQIAEVIMEERKRFEHNKREYIFSIIKEEKKHILFRKIEVSNRAYINEEALNIISAEERDFFTKCQKRSIRYSMNCRISIPTLVGSIINDHLYAHNILNRWNKYRDYISIVEKLDRMYCPSMGRQISYIMDRLKKGIGRPFLCQLHFEEPHYFNTFLSYDLGENEMRKEIDILKEDMKSLDCHYSGLLQYRQSVIYADYWVGRLFEFLKQTGLLDNTIVCITSDHGTSYCYEPIRNERLVTNYHTANYHIPLLIYDAEQSGSIAKGFHTSKDVVPTLLDLAGIRIPHEFKGVSMMKSDNQTICHSEYLGSGFPDITSRVINYAARDDNFLIAYEVHAYEGFDEGELRYVYDLKKDPAEVNNIRSSVNKDRIGHLLNHLRIRHNEIRGYYMHNIAHHTNKVIIQ